VIRRLIPNGIPPKLKWRPHRCEEQRSAERLEVTESAGKLQKLGVITYHRGHITVWTVHIDDGCHDERTRPGQTRGDLRLWSQRRQDSVGAIFHV